MLRKRTSANWAFLCTRVNKGMRRARGHGDPRPRVLIRCSFLSRVFDGAGVDVALKGPPQKRAEQKVTCYASYEEEYLGLIVFEPLPDRPPPAFGMGLVPLCVSLPSGGAELVVSRSSSLRAPLLAVQRR